MDRLIDLETDWAEPPTGNDRLNELYRYWKQSCGTRTHPSRRNIRPAHVSRILRHVFLIDVEPDDFRFRLAGSHFVENTGLRMTGSAIAEIFPEMFCREVREAWGHCASRGVPVLGRGRAWIPDRDFLDWEGIVLPLSEPEQPVNMLFGAIEFRPRRYEL
jgi:hypothetical protein